MGKQITPEWGALTGDRPLTEDEIEGMARNLLAQMTLDEKIAQMSGDLPFFPSALKMVRSYNYIPIPAGENTRLGIPGIRFSDGPRGVVLNHSTCFPVAMARGASWDPALEESIGDAIGVEARAQGANFFGGVCINLLRHPAWGRAQETYGEDPYHLGEMGAALVRGVQRHIMACIKHFACNSIERSRFRVNVRVDERTLHEVYTPHFKRCIDEGAAAVMSAYNKVNGEYCGNNRRLLTGLLREEWGFQGFVISDFVWGVRTTRESALAGLDIEMPFTTYYGRRLKRLVRRGEVPQAVIDQAVLRILRQKIRFSRVGVPGRYRPEAVACPEHRNLARQAAEQSAVLLKNAPVNGRPLLPLDFSGIRQIAVLGRLADTPVTGDLGSSMVRPPYVVTPLQGLRSKAPAAKFTYCPGRDLATARAAAQAADIAIVVAGYTHEDEGEYISSVFLIAKEKGGDRRSLTLSPHDEALIRQTAAINPRTVVVLIGGSAIITEAWREQVPAILMLWYSGMEGGHALANLLSGAANPGGKLPCTFPRSAGQLPFFDDQADEIEYGYYHGYRLLERNGEEAAFPFGFGLSYTTFAIQGLQLEKNHLHATDTLALAARVQNTGDRPGAEVLQVYIGCQDSRYERPLKELKAFQKIFLQPGEERTLHFHIPLSRLAIWDQGWHVEPGEYRLWVGNSSRREDLIEERFVIHS